MEESKCSSKPFGSYSWCGSKEDYGRTRFGSKRIHSLGSDTLEAALCFLLPYPQLILALEEVAPP